ncbi:hypothetical protein HK104_006281, partial [Borealophlyctis nickersoniae]
MVGVGDPVPPTLPDVPVGDEGADVDVDGVENAVSAAKAGRSHSGGGGGDEGELDEGFFYEVDEFKGVERSAKLMDNSLVYL